MKYICRHKFNHAGSEYLVGDILENLEPWEQDILKIKGFISIPKTDTEEEVQELEAKAGKRGLSPEGLWLLDEVINAVQPISSAVLNMQPVVEQTRLNMINDHEITKAQIVEGFDILSRKLDSVRNAIKNVGAKLDSEDVTNLDTDYEQGINADLGNF